MARRQGNAVAVDEVVLRDGTRAPAADLAHIVPELRHLAVPMDSLVRDPRNARGHNERNLGAIKASLLKYGQRLPVVVQEDGRIIRVGNGRHEAASALGWRYIAAVVVDDTTPEAVGFALVDNRSAELATWNYEVLSQLVDEMRAGDLDVSLTELGWTESELGSLSLVQTWDSVHVGDSGAGDDGAGVTLPSSTIRVTAEQKARIDAALGVAKDQGAPTTTPGETLAWLCDEWRASIDGVVVPSC